MASKASSTDIASGVSKLSLEISPASKSSKAQQTKKKPAPVVADSWEDEDVSSGDEDGNDSAHSGSDHEQDEDQDGKASRSGGSSQAGTAAPPPTPMSPTYGSKRPFSPSNVNAASFDLAPYVDPAGSASSLPGAGPVKRPEKTDAVARRMIASALGVKVPKMTEEQKKYDQAMREKERRRRQEGKEREKQREEEAAKAKQAVWED